MLILLLAAALAQTSVPVSTLPPVDGLVQRTIWPELFNDLFAQQFDVLVWWQWSMDVPFNPTGPTTYYGQNQYGQPYALHVRTIDELDVHANPNLTFWRVDVAIESFLATRETHGLVITDSSDTALQSFYFPVMWFDHYPPPDDAHDCSPPAIPPDLCDVMRDCDHGALKYLDGFCAEITGGTYTVACELAWDLYASAMEAADANYQSCDATALGLTATCMVTACGAGPFAPLAVVVCAIAGALQSQNCSNILHAAETLAWNNRRAALKAATANFNNQIKLCCKDCPSSKPPKEQKGGPQKR